MNKDVEKKITKLPTFRGRFGTRSKRKKSIAKWDKWRVAQGIDIKWKRENGAQPSIGYRQTKELRDTHPKGLKEIYVKNEKDLNVDKKDAKKFVFRLAATIGKKKRELLIKKADENKLHILNK